MLTDEERSEGLRRLREIDERYYAALRRQQRRALWSLAALVVLLIGVFLWRFWACSVPS